MIDDLPEDYLNNDLIYFKYVQTSCAVQKYRNKYPALDYI